MNGEPNKYTNFMHAYNTFLNCFWACHFSMDYWASDPFLMADIRDTNILLIELFNSSEDNMTIGMLSFIDGLKPMPTRKWSKNYTYPTQMTFYDDSCDEHGYGVQYIFHKTMELLKHQSIQQIAKEEMQKAGLPYMIVN